MPVCGLLSRIAEIRGGPTYRVSLQTPYHFVLPFRSRCPEYEYTGKICLSLVAVCKLVVAFRRFRGENRVHAGLSTVAKSWPVVRYSSKLGTPALYQGAATLFRQHLNIIFISRVTSGTAMLSQGPIIASDERE